MCLQQLWQIGRTNFLQTYLDFRHLCKDYAHILALLNQWRAKVLFSFYNCEDFLQIYNKYGILTFQGHPRWNVLAQYERSYMTSYLSLHTNYMPILDHFQVNRVFLQMDAQLHPCVCNSCDKLAGPIFFKPTLIVGTYARMMHIS